MELLCPNCQQRVTVPDHFAGQVMKCPLCGNTFTTPSLASATGPAFVPPPSPPPAEPEPFAALSPPPASSDSAPVPRTAALDPITGDYRHRLSIWLSPRVLPWIAVAALVIVFVLMFFSWVGYFPGGIPVATQSAWRAAFGGYSSYDPELAKGPAMSNVEGKDQIEGPANVLMIFFVLFIIVALIASLISAALGILSIRLPATLERLKPWRWAIVSGLTLLALLFFVLQLLNGFSLTNRLRDRVQTFHAEHSKAADNPAAKRQWEIGLAVEMRGARNTCALWASFWLMLLALVCAFLTFVLGRLRTRPLPRIELLW